MACEPSSPKLRRIENAETCGERNENGGHVDDKTNAENKELPASLELLRSLQLTRILKNRSYDKFISIHGVHNESKKDAIIILEKTPFPSDLSVFSHSDHHWVTSGDTVMQNDVYHKLKIDTASEVGLSSLKATVIYPTTPNQIAKQEDHPLHLLLETPSIYEKIVRPHVEDTLLSLNWVYNILDGKAETERVIFSDDDPENGFLLSADLKWDGQSLEDMYCLAVVRRKDLKSLRDLRGDKHLPLIRNIGTKCRQVLAQKFGILESQLRAYFHYHPSFYHLHVHFNFSGVAVSGAEVERAHLLDTVIYNLERIPDYYQHATLTVGVRANDPLYQLIVAEQNRSTTN